MLQELRELGYFFLNLIGYAPIFMVIPCVLWVVVSHYYVYRRGGIAGLVRWHQNNLRLGFNDAKNSLAILGYGLLSLIFCIPTAYDPLTAFCTLLSAAFFLIMACFIAERRNHWPMLKASAIEVILEHSSPNHS
jgi:hypothetical protein